MIGKVINTMVAWNKVFVSQTVGIHEEEKSYNDVPIQLWEDEAE